MKSRRIIVSVINDLVSDQRVKRSCGLLHELGFEVLLVGRVLPGSPPLDQRPYVMHRMRLLFRKGPLFYLEFQIRLWFFLLTHRSDFLLSNDLDTLLPNFLHSGSKRRLIYDTHEYFTAVPELQHSPLKRKIWEKLEAAIFPSLEYVITVNQSIAGVYEELYGKKLKVVRNVPAGFLRSAFPARRELRNLLGLPPAPMMILQGSGINIQRGAEEAVESLQYLPGWYLLIVGSGDVFPILPELAGKFGVKDRLIIRNRMPWNELMQHTMCADIGLSLDKDTNLNYRFSLPNKLFDYIQCGVPVIGSALPEIKRIVQRYDAGLLIDIVDAKSIAHAALELYPGTPAHERCASSCLEAAPELCWEKEKRVLEELFQSL